MTMSRYTGVTQCGMTGKWSAYTSGHGRRKFLGRWPTAREAAVARYRADLHFGNEPRLRVPHASRALGPASPTDLQRLARLRHHELYRSSPYLGVSRSPGGKWIAKVYVGGKSVRVTGYTREKDAAEARDRLALHLKGRAVPLNFPKRKLKPASFNQLRRELGLLPAGRKRKYVGLMSPTKNSNWRIRVRKGSQKFTLGGFLSKRAAAKAHDRLALHLLGPDARLNYPNRKLTPASLDELRSELPRYKSKTSRFRGVLHRPRNERSQWEAFVHFGGRRVSAGDWQTECEAALARDRAFLFHDMRLGPLNFPKLARALGPMPASDLVIQSRRAFKSLTSSRYRGVHAANGRWVAEIRHRSRKVYLGRFDDELAAARAYDEAAATLHGQAAKLNFDPTGVQMP